MADNTKVTYAVSLLVGGTGGQASWPDETIELYVHELADACIDGESLIRACRVVVRDWQSLGRPPLGVIREAYRAEVTRRELDRPALSPGEERIPTFEEGIAIARDAYHAERYRMGLPSSDTHFERWLGLSKEARKEAAEEREAHSGSRGEFRRRR